MKRKHSRAVSYRAYDGRRMPSTVMAMEAKEWAVEATVTAAVAVAMVEGVRVAVMVAVMVASQDSRLAHCSQHHARSTTARRNDVDASISPRCMRA